MKKYQYTKRLIALLMLVLMTMMAVTGCRDTEEPTEPTEPPTEDMSYLEAYSDYVFSVLDANYHGEYTGYIQITGATKQQASMLTEAHAVALAEQMAELYAIQLAQIPEAVGDRLKDVAYEVYREADYSVGEAQKVGEKIYVTVSVKPLKFYEGISAKIDTYVSEFNDRAKEGEFESMTASEYENEYAKGILEVLEGSMENIERAEAKTYRIEIRYNEETGVSYIAEEDLDAINRLILADWEG